MIRPAKTKLPKPFAGSLRRAKLLEELLGSEASVLVFHGKAGYGKTELARQLCEEFAGLSAWCRLDVSDNEPERFAVCLDAVFSDSLSGYAGENEEPLLSQILLRAEEALEAEDQRFLLVLDSFETIENEKCQDFLRRMAEESGGKLCLCLITRGRIPDFLSRFVTNGSCRILDEEELAFSPEEERKLWRRLLPGERKAWEPLWEQVHIRLQGWPAGVMLAGLFFQRYGVLSGPPNWEFLLQASRIGSFLDFELFGPLPEEEKNFLLQTAGLKELNAKLCDAVLERENSRGLIRSLLEKNIFCCDPCSQTAGICRHPIVELYLESRGDQKQAAGTACRAAQYCLEKREFLKAARQAAGAGHTPLLLTLMEQFGGELLQKEQWEVLEICVRYLEREGFLTAGKVPDRRIAGETEALGTAAQYYYRTGQTERMEDCLNQADSTFGKENKFGMYRALYRGLLHYRADEEKNQKQICNTLFLLEENHVPLPYLKPEERELLTVIKKGGAGEKNGRLKVTFFGDFRAQVNGEEKPLSFRTRKGGELFAYMIKQNGKPVGRKQLLAALWSDGLPDNAVTMLHNMLYNLRKELSAYRLENLIEYKDKVYRVHMEQVETDLPEIDRLCRMADQSDPGELLRHAERFKSYWGRYLEDVDGLWAVEDREYYDTRFMKACSILAKEAAKSGRPAEGALFYKNAMLVNGYSEEWEAGLLRCYGKMGNLRQVKDEYERFCAFVKKELQTGPGEKLRQAYREIVEA